MKLIAAAAAASALLASAVQAYDVQTVAAFSSWKKDFGVEYSIKEEMYRLGVFADNVATIEAHNAGEESFKLGMNQFTGMTNAEYRKTMLSEVVPEVPSTTTHASVAPNPTSADWRLRGAVTDVKDQGQCGSCWAFSTTGSLEGAWMLASHPLIALSEQELVDCSGSYGNNGCQGGLMDNAFSYIVDHGLSTEESYPYHPVQGTCDTDNAIQGATMTSFTDIAQGSESDLLNAIGTVGPVSIAIDASHKSFQMYHSGVYNERKCSSTQLDHGVLAVGYGTDKKGKDFWIVKNSWSTVWGNQGYIEMSRGKNNQCGVASAASYPNIH